MGFGRPSKLNEQLIQDLGDKLRKGLPLTTCCDLLGITTMSCSNWSKQGEDDFNNEIESLHADFFYTIKKAKAEFEEEACEKIKSGETGWQGMAWWLERTRPQYMPKQEIVADEGKVQVVLGGKIKDIKRNDAGVKNDNSK